MKKIELFFKKHIFIILRIVIILPCLICLIIFPAEIATGVKNSLTLLGSNIIPSLFPFMILSSYISASCITDITGNFINKLTCKVFGVSGKGFGAVMLGLLGGYPIGAKTVTEFYENGSITKNEANKLLCWCVNPSPAFVITALGKFLLGSSQQGLIIYICTILSSFTIGIVVNIFKRDTGHSSLKLPCQNQKNAFVLSVSSASSSMISICSWVLIFGAISAGLDCIVRNESIKLFVKSVSEVTNACKSAALSGFSIPLMCAIVSFGGFAVIFQIVPYLQKCGFSIKLFTALRALNSSLSAFYCTLFLKLFPQSADVVKTINFGSTTVNFSHSITASVFLIIMCVVLILEVDYKKKLC